MTRRWPSFEFFFIFFSGGVRGPLLEGHKRYLPIRKKRGQALYLRRLLKEAPQAVAFQGVVAKAGIRARRLPGEHGLWVALPRRAGPASRVCFSGGSRHNQQPLAMSGARGSPSLLLPRALVPRLHLAEADRLTETARTRRCIVPIGRHIDVDLCACLWQQG